MTHGERIVVCHSLGRMLWFRAASRLADKERVDRLLVVPPPASEQIPEAGESFRIRAMDRSNASRRRRDDGAGRDGKRDPRMCPLLAP